ncbi:hypothetical protein [Flavobacterium denitrificans]|uniref:hypothetical protein n=1 Tax=Flavobacterium denitrificans TaxID=281361 RepID=UPI00047B5128|nr:hypothetical protein [Flavobacterium denitrificans]
MTKEEIIILFNETLQISGLSRKIEGFSKDVIYNWRNGRGNPPTTGQMLDVLWQLGKIKISHEPTTKS